MTSGFDIYLITGGTGAGKTTYALDLAETIGGLRFSIDDWMTTLFWMDSPDPISHDWALARIDRCEAQIWDMAVQSTARGIPAILDLGFTKTAHREKFSDLAKAAGLTISLHWLDIDATTRWDRVKQRNTDKGETFAMAVDRDMFDFMETLWEAPSAKEMAQLNAEHVMETTTFN